MILGKKLVVVMPAYNAEMTLECTYNEIPFDIVDEVILTDDHSRDSTVIVAKKLGIKHIIVHEENKGYGGNQKSCYDRALEIDADIIIMIHPDYQYDPRVIPYAVGFILIGICDVIIGSRIRDRKQVLRGGMPLYKYISNRFLTTIENFIFGQNLGDFHSGFRVYKREVLEKISYHNNSNDFIFDTEFLAQSIYSGFKIGDIPIPARYFPEASSINLQRSIKYGLQSLLVGIKYIIQKMKIFNYKMFEQSNNNLKQSTNISEELL